ncbi:MAG: hypothetical protein O6922_05570, partial [Chloroflexi bacterium]|nr:hypothetical protein [Chloroflexota bacterium]
MSLPSSQRPARLSRLPGICLALALSSGAYAGGIACDDPNNCQLPDIENFPGGTILTSASTQDNFVPTAGGDITAVCWWGAYIEQPMGKDPFDCGPGPGDSFTITYYTNTPGCPTGAPNAVIASFNVVADKALTGLVFNLGGFPDTVDEYAFSASHDPVPVTAGTCYWIEVSNVTGSDCTFFWEVSPLGPGDGSVSGGASVEFEMAWCIDLALDPDTSACALAIDPLCEGAKGACGEGNGSPGCDDPCCCTLVCQQDPGCCEAEWDDFCAGFALKIGCTTLPPCQAEANCQVFDIVNAFNSTGEGAFFSADDFTPVADGDITDICWYGAYLPDPPDPSLDDFTVRYYDNVDGLPGNVIAEFSQGGGTLIGLVREDSGAQVAGLPLFVFSATHAPVAVESGVCYWIEISNPNDGNFAWFWEWAPTGAGNRRMVQDATTDDPYAQVDLVGAGRDLAFCIGMPVDVPCGIEVVFDTGPHRTVSFNGVPTHLGWSSGNLDNAIDLQRRTSQAFTLPALPPGPSQWNVNQVEVEGFDPELAGFSIEFLNFEIFTRTALDVAPGPGDSLATGTVAFDPADDIDDPITERTVIFLNGVSLPPGDYWVTMWASNAAGGLANFAWFTFAEFGINNF